jgi:hypothetical protein
VLNKSGAKYSILYASQPYGLLENTSELPLARYLAEKTNTTKPILEACDGECQLKSTLLEGVFVVSCYLESILLFVTFSSSVGMGLQPVYFLNCNCKLCF